MTPEEQAKDILDTLEGFRCVIFDIDEWVSTLNLIAQAIREAKVEAYEEAAQLVEFEVGLTNVAGQIRALANPLVAESTS